MSANAHQSRLAIAVGPPDRDGANAPTASASAAPAAGVAATSHGSNADALVEPATAPAPAEVPLPASATPPPAATTLAADRPSRRLAVTGYMALLLATALAVAIPHFRLHAGAGENALMVVAIVGVSTGATLVTAAFVLHLLRRR